MSQTEELKDNENLNIKVFEREHLEYIFSYKNTSSAKNRR
jgi:hypothetical protein